MSTKEKHRHSEVGPANLWKMKRDFQFQFLRAKGLAQHHYILDMGCGTLRGGIPLINFLQDGHYFGIEVRAEVLEEGRKELIEAGLDHKNPTLLQPSNNSQLMINQQFDFIWAFSVLFHMSDNTLDEALDLVSSHLTDTGVFYANVKIGERQEGNWGEFPVVWRSMEFYHHKCSKHDLILDDLGTLKDNGHISNLESHDMQRMLRITK